jgi:hypothetical protein
MTVSAMRLCARLGLTGTMLLLTIFVASPYSLTAPAHAAFTPRGIIGDVMADGGAPKCGQLIHWFNHHSDKDRGTLGYWILGFFTGVETQMVNEPAFAKSTGVEMRELQILEATRGFCKDNPKAGALDAIVSLVRFGLEESVKHPHPGYKHGPNIHGRIVYGKTCQNLIMETVGETTNEGGKWKGTKDPDNKFSVEEWMLGAASGIELMALHNNPIQGTKIKPDALLAQFYKTCRDNPTWMIVQAVMDQEEKNIEAAREEAAKEEAK